MTAVALLAECRQRGLTLTAEEGRLLVRPAGQADDELLARLQAWKAELLVLLAAASDAELDRDDESLDPPTDWDAANPSPEPRSFSRAWPWTRKPWCDYGHPTAWRSIYGSHLICETCHPPATEEAVAERGITEFASSDPAESESDDWTE